MENNKYSKKALKVQELLCRYNCTYNNKECTKIILRIKKNLKMKNKEFNKFLENLAINSSYGYSLECMHITDKYIKTISWRDGDEYTKRFDTYEGLVPISYPSMGYLEYICNR